MKREAKTLAKLPRLESDAEAERFVADSDLTQYALSALKPTRFEFARKEARINMRFPGELLSAVKRAAKRRGVLVRRSRRLSRRAGHDKPSAEEEESRPYLANCVLIRSLSFADVARRTRDDCRIQHLAILPASSQELVACRRRACRT
jgi:predicted DNA binding CopG/RHH family protein